MGLPLETSLHGEFGSEAEALSAIRAIRQTDLLWAAIHSYPPLPGAEPLGAGRQLEPGPLVSLLLGTFLGALVGAIISLVLVYTHPWLLAALLGAILGANLGALGVAAMYLLRNRDTPDGLPKAPARKGAYLVVVKVPRGQVSQTRELLQTLNAQRICDQGL